MGELKWRWGMGLIMVQLVVLGSTVEAEECFKSVFAFGDGIFDTGSVSAVFPSILNYDFPPYGMTYFKQPAGRFSDGRLVLDFLTEALGLPMIPSYLQTVASDFSNGASFASAYSTIGTVSTGQTAGPLMFLSPFAISVQALHYSQFKTNTRNIIQETKEDSKIAMEGTEDTSLMARLPPYEEFADGLYLFSTGAHDIVNYLNKNFSINFVESKFSELLNAYTSTIRALINHHLAKNIIVFDVEPLGCQPFLLTLIPHTPEDVDNKGCLVAENNLVKKFNKMLKKKVESWRSAFTANVVFLSQYDIKMELMNDATSGFVKTNAACCGLPVSPYNVLIAVQCGPPVFDPESQKEVSAFPCEDPGSHLYWDAMYTTETANRYITEKILTGNYFDIPFERFTSCAKNSLS